MNTYLETNGSFALWAGEPINGRLHSRQIATLWTDAQLAAIGLFRPVAAAPIPDGHYVTATSVQRVEGVVQFVHTTAPIVPTTDDVDAERDRRIASDFVFDDVVYQSRPSDLENIAGAATAALGAIVGGAQPDDLRWHGGASDFTWIAADNSLTPMDAHTLFAFGRTAMAHKQAHIFAARAIKDMDPIPSDYATNEAYWP
jgi:hypothetical protein